MTRREWALVPLLAVWLTGCDQFFHIRTATLEYHWHPQLFGQTIIVPVVFAVAVVAMFHTAGAVKGGSRGSLVASMLIATGAYLVSGLLTPRFAMAYAIVLVALWLARVALRRDPRLVLLGIVIAAGGVTGEAVLSAAGEFDYLDPDVLGVPWWLFGLYLHGSLVAFDLIQRLRESPPSTGSMTPLKKLAAGDNKNAAARPNSSG